MRVVGYIRVSTEEQGESGAGLDAQRAAIEQAVATRGWQLVRIERDVASGKNTKRPGLTEALVAVESGAADGLVVAKLDRLSRSLVDFASLMERSRRRGWSLVALDLGVDTSTPQGEMMAAVLATFAQFERRLIGQRTREALAIKRAQGVHTGRRSTLDPAVRGRVRRMAAAGTSLAAIARTLNAECVPTGQGGKCWYPSSVGVVLRLTEAEDCARVATRGRLG